MARYKTKPCEIEAIQWNGQNIDEIKLFAYKGLSVNHEKEIRVFIHTLE